MTKAIREREARKIAAREKTANPLSEHFADSLKRADEGDGIAAREALGVFALLLSNKNTHPRTGKPLPVAPYVRDYLSRAFSRMASGTEPAAALNLTNFAKRQWEHIHKTVAINIVVQFIEFGYSVQQACQRAADVIKESAHKHPGDVWELFARKPPAASTLRNWYFDLSSEQ